MDIKIGYEHLVCEKDVNFRWPGQNAIVGNVCSTSKFMLTRLPSGRDRVWSCREEIGSAGVKCSAMGLMPPGNRP